METETDPQIICHSYDVRVEQESLPEADREKELKGDGSILLKIAFCKAIFNRHSVGGPRVCESSRTLTNLPIRVQLGRVKKIQYLYRRLCRRHIANVISSRAHLIDVPNEVRIKAVRKLFYAIDKAVHPERPIQLRIWNITERTWDARIKSVPATMDSNIEGLERLRLQVLEGEACAICLAEYDQPAVLVTRLPCSHYFHGDCITRWLHTHRICPLCRFAMPLNKTS